MASRRDRRPREASGSGVGLDAPGAPPTIDPSGPRGAGWRRTRTDMSEGPDDVRSVLVVRLSALGDVVHALPAVAALRRRLPRARIDVLVEDRAAPLVSGAGGVDRAVVFPRAALSRAARSPRGLREARSLLRAFLEDLRRVEYDATLDLQGNLKSGVLARLARARLRLGPAREEAREGNWLFQSRRAPALPPGLHRVERNLALASRLVREPLAWAPPALPDTSALAGEVEAALLDAGAPASGFAALHPGTSGFGAFKRWPPAHFGRLADLLAARDLASVVLCAPAERDLAGAAAAASRARPPVVATPSLLHLVEALRRARLLVAADTGPLHLAAALRTPVLGLYGPKDPATYGPYGPRPGRGPGVLPVLVRANVPCRPCGLRWCSEPVCMTSLDPEDVAAALA
jgi:heptosyltransferase-1